MIAMDVPPVAAVGVGLREFEVAAYRPSVRAGAARFSVTNLGEDPHDLAIRAVRAPRRFLAATAQIKPGGHGTLRVSLRPGRYELLCTIGDHAQRGMRTTITVQAARRTA
ncbi:MAG: hypothetical protein QOK49_1634 [Baekduia sp.]|jgi:plastocyanin|nr:hypothetical protein [Baekduia sp.]